MTALASQPISAEHRRPRRVLPGFGLSLGYTIFFLSVIVLIPLAGLLRKTASLTWADFWTTVTDPLVVSAYKLSFGAAMFAAIINGIFGLLVAWVLVRYRFPGRRILDAMIDFPFALPTAVAGITFGNLYSNSGWLGRLGFNRFLIFPIGWLMNRIGIAGEDRTVGAVTIVLVFVGLPFIVRTIQPVLQDLDRDLEQAAASLGASPFYAFRRVVFPQLFSAWLAGMALAFARAVGEYGSVIYVARNQPGESEIAPLRIVTELYGDNSDRGTARATAIALVLLLASLLILVLINGMQWWARRSERS
jgi:sulfate transport system permease protein